ncbi:nicotinate-nucleotide--dimethylbenzimidazole phosphoribosyltransferase [Paraglaciecola sp.]|uniref:nicotinate-nucleotide--dimethylbenzimidazole phosphoribosyltransferase n=1 Tax=Paraglaciecola sp. TaxID=1920173 RepID=UPI00326528EF
MTQTTAAIFTSHYWNIPDIDNSRMVDIQKHIDCKTKPIGALGRLERLAAQLALIQGMQTAQYDQISIISPCIIVFAGDHGIAKHGISIAPSAVTSQMVSNFLTGGAAINCLCNSLNIGLKIVDTGILFPVPSDSENYSQQRLGDTTHDFSEQAAMTLRQVEQGLSLGAKIASKQLAKGSNVLGFGEMGIGNTSSASALLSLLTGTPATETVGLGTGIDSEQLKTKIELVEKALLRISIIDIPPHLALAEVGGFEIVQIVGAMLATAAAGRAILVDGFIISVAALVAIKISPEARQFMIFAHCSAEKGHQLALSELTAQPLLDLGLRLGEGTGAALAVPLLNAAASFYNNMATFESADIKV